MQKLFLAVAASGLLASLFFSTNIMLSLSVGQVSAQGAMNEEMPTPSNRPRLMPQGQTDLTTTQPIRQEKEQSARVAVCEKNRERLTSQQNQFAQVRQGQTQRYQELMTKTNDVVTKVEAQGLDASNVKQDLAKLQQMITQHLQAMATYQDQLGMIRNEVGDCQVANDQVKSQLAQARTELQTVRQAAQAIRSYIQTTLRPDIKALGEELRATKQQQLRQQVQPSASPVSATPANDVTLPGTDI